MAWNLPAMFTCKSSEVVSTGRRRGRGSNCQGEAQLIFQSSQQVPTDTSSNFLLFFIPSQFNTLPSKMPSATTNGTNGHTNGVNGHSKSALCTVDEFLTQSYDYLIIGGGTAGLCVAARLTEDPKVKVGVLEV